ncbi:MAG: GNAT family N-acetyltransferase [Caldilineaceae bacterium]
MLHLQTYINAADFLSVTQTVLEEDEVSNGLMLGIALRLQENPERAPEDLFLATVNDGATLGVAALMTPPHNVVVFSQLPEPFAAFDFLITRLLDWPQQPLGVNGRKEWAQRFAECWHQRTGQPYHAAVQLRSYRLDQVLFGVGVAPGAMRVATLQDLPLVIQWLDEFEREALPHAVGRNRQPGAEEWQIKQGNLFLWEDGDQVVALAGRSRPTAHGISVGPVYTPPSLRGRGYATALVAELSQHLLDSGYQFTTLFTDLANPTSNNIYQKIGYQPVCDFTEYSFESKND